MIARPKISRNEWKPAEIGAFEVGNFALFCCPGGDAAPLAAVELARALRVERYSKRPDPTRFALKLRDGPPLKLRARDAAAAERWIAALDAWVQRS